MNKKIKIGAKVKTINNNSNLAVGTKTTINSLHGNNTHFSLEGGNGTWVQDCDVEFLPLTIEELQNSLKEADDKIASINIEKNTIFDQISYMTETNLTEFDETEYKAYKTIKLLSSDITDLEKAKLIASLINS